MLDLSIYARSPSSTGLRISLRRQAEQSWRLLGPLLWELVSVEVEDRRDSRTLTGPCISRRFP